MKMIVIIILLMSLRQYNVLFHDVHINIQGGANKSNPLPCFVNISTTNRNFY